MADTSTETTTEGYVGRVVVTKATKTVHQPTMRQGHVTDRAVERHSVEVLDVTVRANTEYGVRVKLAQALELLDGPAQVTAATRNQWDGPEVKLTSEDGRARGIE